MALVETIMDLAKLGMYPPPAPVVGRQDLTNSLELLVRASCGGAVSISAGSPNVMFAEPHNRLPDDLLFVEGQANGRFEVTISNGTPAILTGYLNAAQPGCPLRLWGAAELPAPLLPGEVVYVLANGFSENDQCQISRTPNGAPIETTSEATGTLFAEPLGLLPFPLVEGVPAVVASVVDETTVTLKDTNGEPLTFLTDAVGMLTAYTGKANPRIDGSGQIDPFADLQSAFSYFVANYNLNGYSVSIGLSPGTHSGLGVTTDPGSGYFQIGGNGAITRLLNEEGAIAFLARLSCEVSLSDFEVGTSNLGLRQNTSNGAEINTRNFALNRNVADLNTGDAAVTIVPDTLGGWFVGGDVGSGDQNFCTHITPEGTIDTTFPSADSTVRALALTSGETNRLYLGGLFSNVGSISASYLVALNTLDWSQATVFATTVNGAVDHLILSPDGARLYLAGDFSQVNGTARNHIAAVQTSNGSLISAFNITQASSVIYAMALSDDGSKLYVSGHDGNSSTFFKAFNTTTGANIPGFVPPLSNTERVGAIVVSADGTTVYGAVYDSNNAPGGAIRLWNAADGAEQVSWALNAPNEKFAMARAADGGVFVGGAFTTVAGVQFNRCLKLSPEGIPLNWPNVSTSASVLAIALDPEHEKMFLGFLGGISADNAPPPAFLVTGGNNVVTSNMSVGAMAPGAAAFAAMGSGSTITVNHSTLVDSGTLSLAKADGGGRVEFNDTIDAIGTNVVSFEVGPQSTIVLSVGSSLNGSYALGRADKNFSGVLVGAPTALNLDNAFGQIGDLFKVPLPTADPVLNGALWNDGGVVKVSAG